MGKWIDDISDDSLMNTWMEGWVGRSKETHKNDGCAERWLAGSFLNTLNDSFDPCNLPLLTKCESKCV